MKVKQYIARMALVVRDYDEAIQFYTEKLDFTLVEDTKLSDVKRWVVIRPPGDSDTCLLLAKAANAKQEKAIGNQTGGRVFLFMYTDDFHRDYKQMIARGVEFVRDPVEEEWGTVAVFKDLYGNLWDFIEPSR